VNAQVLRQLTQQFGRTTLALCAGALAFFYLVLSSSAAFLSQASGTVPFLRDPPRAMRALLGGAADFTSPAGWLVTAMAHPITLGLLTAAALTVATGAIAGEVERGTLDFVLTRPVSRGSYLGAVSAAAVLGVTAVELAAFLATLLARQTVDGVQDLDLSGVARVFLGSWVLFVALSAVAVLISANVGLRSRAVALSVGFTLLSFGINVVALMLDQLYPLRRLSLFHYFQPADLLDTPARLDELVVPGLVAVAATAVAAWSFTRRDIAR
jgi:ABC-2 type transport system permease protein